MKEKARRRRLDWFEAVKRSVWLDQGLAGAPPSRGVRPSQSRSDHREVEVEGSKFSQTVSGPVRPVGWRFGSPSPWSSPLGEEMALGSAGLGEGVAAAAGQTQSKRDWGLFPP